MLDLRGSIMLSHGTQLEFGDDIRTALVAEEGSIVENVIRIIKFTPTSRLI